MTISIMTSSDGNISRVTGLLGGESNGHRWRFDVCFYLRLNKRLRNNRDVGDLRRDHAHYHVSVRCLQYDSACGSRETSAWTAILVLVEGFAKMAVNIMALHHIFKVVGYI